MTGKAGDDTYVYVPCGTIVSEKMSPQILDYLDEQENYDFNDDDLPVVTMEKDKSKLLVASGGRPGLGNKVFAGTQERRGRSAVCIMLCFMCDICSQRHDVRAVLDKCANFS